MAYIFSIFWFLVITLLICLYAFIIFYIFKLLGFILRKITKQKKIDLPPANKLQAFMFDNKLLSVFLIVLTLNIIITITYLPKYINSDMAYKKTKSLFLVGNIANGYSKILSNIASPDKIYLAPFNEPLNFIKKAMYSQAVSYLPEDEPERYLLKYDWFYYPYVMRFYDVLGYKAALSKKYKTWEETYKHFHPAIVELWDILKNINEKEFKDKNREADAILSMPAIGEYFYLNRLWLYETKKEQVEKSIFLSTEPIFVNLNKDIYTYITKNFDEMLKNNKKANEYIKTHPKIMANRYILRLFIMDREISILIHKREFSCEHPYVKEYVDFRNFYFSNKNEAFNALRANNKGQLVDEYIEASKDNVRAEYVRQLLRGYCEVEVLGISRQALRNERGNWGSYKDLVMGGICNRGSVFSEEIRIIESELNMTNTYIDPDPIGCVEMIDGQWVKVGKGKDGEKIYIQIPDDPRNVAIRKDKLSKNKTVEATDE